MEGSFVSFATSAIPVVLLGLIVVLVLLSGIGALVWVVDLNRKLDKVLDLIDVWGSVRDSKLDYLERMVRSLYDGQGVTELSENTTSGSEGARGKGHRSDRPKETPDPE